jgi:hypothetical protein
VSKKFKVGDRVRVITKKYGEDQYGDVGVVEELRGEPCLPVSVRFDELRKQNCATNSYEHEDLEAFPVKKKTPKGPQAYKGNEKHEWEVVACDDILEFGTYRLRVPGGWLYGTSTVDGMDTVTFVPLPEAVGYAV